MEQQDKAIVGRVSFANGEKIEYTNAQEYVKCVAEELPYRATSGFQFETLTDDPQTRKAVDDLVCNEYGEENPCPLENYYNDVEKAAANEREEPLDAEIGIRETGVPVGLLNRRIEPGYVLENGIVLLESERDENGHYVGGAGMDGMYLRTGDLYKPCMDAQGNVRAFRQVQPEKEKTPVAADDRASVKAKLEGLKKPTPQRKPKQRDRGAR